MLLNIPRTNYNLTINWQTVILLLLALYFTIKSCLLGKYLVAGYLSLLTIAWFLIVPTIMYFGMKNVKPCNNADCKCKGVSVVK